MARSHRTRSHQCATKRVFEPASLDDGARFLVERLWPRGLKKEGLHARAWLKDAAPSDSLRRWFGHDPGKWREFEERYFAELDGNRQAIDPLRAALRSEAVTLLYSARDREHNSAVALKAYLEGRAQ